MNILAVFAHPDDETVLAGGLLSLLAKLGNEVNYMICTRGEGGEVGDPPVSAQQELGLFRELELKNAVEQLGGNSLTILNFVDPVVGENNQLFSFTDDQPLLRDLILKEMDEKKIDVLISHGSNGEYGHPGHLTVFETAKEAVNSQDGKVTWYTCQAVYEDHPKPHLTNRDDPADWVVDVSSVAAEKLAAIASHQSQHSLFKRRKSRELGRMISLEEILQLEESYCLQTKTNDDVLRNILEPNGFLKKC